MDNREYIFESIKHRIEKNSLSANYGLYDGLMGEVLFSLLSTKLYDEKDFYSLGFSGLENIQKNIHKIKFLNRSNGLAGIGWAIEWLGQNNFIEANTNEILEDVDSILYKFISFSSDEKISFEDGIIDKIIYFLQRFNNKSISRYKKYIHRECITYLSDDLSNKFENIKIKILEQISKFDINDKETKILSEILLISCSLSKINVNPFVCDQMLYESVDLIKNVLNIYNTDSFFSKSVTNSREILQLIASLATAGNEHKNSSWTELSARSAEIYFSRQASGISDNRLNWKYLRAFMLLNAYLNDPFKKVLSIKSKDLINNIVENNMFDLYKIVILEKIETKDLDNLYFFYF